MSHLSFAPFDRFMRTNRKQIAFTGVVVALLVTRLYGITHQSLWFDEGYTLSLVSADGVKEALHIFAGFTTSERLQPLYYLLMFLWSRVAGTSDLALRLPSAIFSVIGGAAVYGLASQVMRGHRVFVLATTATYATYLLSSYSIYYAQEARPYALVQCLAFVLLFVWTRLQQGHPQSTRPLTWMTVLCFFASPFTGMLAVTLCVADLIVLPARGAWILRWTRPVAWTLGSYSVYLTVCAALLPKVITADITTLRQPLWMNLCYSIYGLLFGTTIGASTQALRGAQKIAILLQAWPVYLLSALVLAGFAAMVWSQVRSRKPMPVEVRTLSLAAVLYTVLFLVGFGVLGHLNLLPRHSSALFALLFLLLMLFAAQIQTAADAKFLACALAGYFLLNFLSVCNYHFNNNFRKDDYRQIAQELQREASTPPTFMAAGRPDLIEHYGFNVIPASDVAPDDFARFVQDKSHAAEEIQIVFNENRSAQWRDNLTPIDKLAGSYACVEQMHAAYMGVYSCKRRTMLSSATSPQQRAPALEQKVTYGN